MKKYSIQIACILVIGFTNILSSSNSKSENRTLMNPSYGTHMAPLLTTVMHSEGPVLEMGCGDYSTPLLHAVCSATKRLLVTAETDLNWMNLFEDLQTPWHHFIHVPINSKHTDAWDLVGNDNEWGVVFIDHAPTERRVIDIIRLRARTKIFVAHDTNKSCYNYEPVLSSFKYRYVYKRYERQTTIVSDTIDVATFFE